MSNNFASAAPIADTNDMTVLVGHLHSCLALADKLDLPMVAIHIEQARSLMTDQARGPEKERAADALS
ncbi:hypothetical protein ASF14_15260 [Sphingomonas sp. Leaf257]|jgi:hypothetical protein|nr:hypothetical protein ASF14_15260 [Sphingomonas sp. Leaf257]